MTSTARIEVQQSFCKNCSDCIKKELQVIEDVNNVRLYPKDSLITFNFFKADRLSAALNVLSRLGYPEKGERVDNSVFKTLCRC
ncbi:hypothetical protein [Winogradskyella jejuensis]|uniref:Copper chaperone CopZ n=1 Tax=Winogradskyella jejuensis TaxID=1089305 RepID=A0A1M5MFT4_9FLAO|nr:hypothetical protein [Winogradskyella jejuensis]SHG75553.1 hypothetical protein SAMN05444148_0875 [Winogradskyella jejuensis]